MRPQENDASDSKPPMEASGIGRRELLTAAGAAGLAAVTGGAQTAAAEAAKSSPDKVYRVGVVSARIKGKSQRTNGHCWQFTDSFNAEIDFDAMRKLLDPGRVRMFEKHHRNPKENFGFLPYRDMQVTQYYEEDPEIAKLYTQMYPGVKVATSLEQMAQEVDCIWMGDGSGYGEDHFDLVAPGLKRGLPTFCDKPIGGSPEGTRKILEFAREHKAPIMSSSLFRHQWGTAEALRRKESGDFGELQYVIACQGGGHNLDRWMVYGQHPTWMVMTLCGPGVEGVSMIEHGSTCHALITYKDRMPAEVWCGRRDIAKTYCSTSVHFEKETYVYTPGIEGNYWLGHHYQMVNMAGAFRQMVKTGVEPVPHQEILEVTAIVHAAAKSLGEKNRQVKLAEVMG